MFTSSPSPYGVDIRIVGLGSSGCNVMDRMIDSGLSDVEFIAINTDSQALSMSRAKVKVQIGEKITKGLGAGGDPKCGLDSLEQDKEKITAALEDADLVFITTGLGGGTGTGCAARIAEIAKTLGALTVGVVTKPFSFEGKKRMRNAEEGMQILREKADTVITIPNDRLLQVTEVRTSLLDAFRIADNILRFGIQGIIDLIVSPGLINLDFADVRTVLSNGGNAMLGMGRSSQIDDRALRATEEALESPLLEYPVAGAKRALINITGGRNLSLPEVDRACKKITSVLDPDANIIFGALIDETVEDEFRVTIIATGLGVEARVIQTAPERKAVNAASDTIDIPAFLRRRR